MQLHLRTVPAQGKVLRVHRLPPGDGGTARLRFSSGNRKNVRPVLYDICGLGKGAGLAGNGDLSYSIIDEQDEKKRLAQAPQSREKSQRKETGRSQDDQEINSSQWTADSLPLGEMDFQPYPVNYQLPLQQSGNK
jgi:hypothetical protein